MDDMGTFHTLVYFLYGFLPIYYFEKYNFTNHTTYQLLEMKIIYPPVLHPPEAMTSSLQNYLLQSLSLPVEKLLIVQNPKNMIIYMIKN